MKLFSIIHRALTHTVLVTAGLLYMYNPPAFEGRLADAGEVLRAVINGDQEGTEALRTAAYSIGAKFESARREIGAAAQDMITAKP
ncbi:hypothetical protein [Thioclava pacifica]|uniref:Uncharacterized protein n=1 Tax=Thioclava pacifica DSM 10166 TaxID=1353537 RepID=A0A074JFV2_9RHOB|nr:hypothetical protein [Thioclava pacifica]KEO56501.1 hypothetical protein TP2_02945 [Thioclava pacifica DSM 10166]